jgi:hypothetical protein
MKRIAYRTAFCFALCVMVLPAATAADGSRHGWRTGDELCLPIDARIDVTFVTEGCDSVVGMCTEGRVSSRRSFLAGTTRFRATGLGGGVVGEASIVFPPAEPASTWSYSGELVITTAVGELHTEDVGVFDTVRGTFTEMNRVVSGTGLLRDARGDLFMSGYSHADGSGFSGDVSGTVCVPRRPAGSLR